MSDFVFSFGQNLIASTWWSELGWPVIWSLIKVVLVLALVAGCVTYATLWERKLLGWVQIRLGPNRVGPWGLLQPIADALKLMTKEIVRPVAADKFLIMNRYSPQVGTSHYRKYLPEPYHKKVSGLWQSVCR